MAALGTKGGPLARECFVATVALNQHGDGTDD